MKEENKSIALNIANYMHIFGISQVALAKQLGCSNTTVSMWVNGDAVPRLPMIDRMCTIFGCDRGDLLGTPKTREEALRGKALKTIMAKIGNLSDEGLARVSVILDDYLRLYHR